MQIKFFENCTEQEVVKYTKSLASFVFLRKYKQQEG